MKSRYLYCVSFVVAFTAFLIVSPAMATVDIELEEAIVPLDDAVAGSVVTAKWLGFIKDGKTGGPWNIGIYLSTDITITTNDTLLGSYTESREQG